LLLNTCSDIMTELHAKQEMLTLSEHLISSLVFIEVYVVLSVVSPCFMQLSCLLDFEF